jgi:hypothetical protein
MRAPDAQLRAGHLPADLYRQLPQEDGRPQVVIVQGGTRDWTGPVVLTVVASLGAGGVLLVLVLLLHVAATAAAALPAVSVGGVTLKVAIGGRK